MIIKLDNDKYLKAMRAHQVCQRYGATYFIKCLVADKFDLAQPIDPFTARARARARVSKQKTKKKGNTI